MHSDLRLALALTVVLSTVASVVVGMALRDRTDGPGSTRPPAPPTLGKVVLHPLAQLLFVCALLYVNQVLFSAYVLRAHGGNAGFIARYIPGPWFAIGRHDPVVGLLARHVGDGQWLSPSLLRVQAFLELPFTMFAYLAVARLLGRRLYATLCRLPLLGLVAVSFSVTFSIIELALPNPYTHDDLVLRALAAALVPMYIAWIARREAIATDVEDGPSGVLGLLAFLAGAGAVAYLVLAVYDAFLLYNLAHLPRYAGGLALASLVAAGASFATPRVDLALRSVIGSWGRSPAVAICVASLRAFTLFFFLPSLSLRYGGDQAVAVLSGLLVVGIAFVAGLAGGLRRTRPSALGVATLVLGAGLALVASGWAANAALVSSAHGSLPELVLARGALSFLAVAIVVFRGVEFAVCWATHETKAPADAREVAAADRIHGALPDAVEHDLGLVPHASVAHGQAQQHRNRRARALVARLEQQLQLLGAAQRERAAGQALDRHGLPRVGARGECPRQGGTREFQLVRIGAVHAARHAARQPGCVSVGRVPVAADKLHLVDAVEALELSL
ncbi:MAG TPA: hypothetical protein VLT33_16710 [Labilithrix sp.]|nr:hypothetical protein [Labilithrix sp.]